MNYNALGRMWACGLDHGRPTPLSLAGRQQLLLDRRRFTTDLYNALNLNGVGALVFSQFANPASLGAAIKLAFDEGKAPTIGIQTPTNFMLISSHQYIVMGYELDGLTGQISNVILRNPWAIDGGVLPSGDPDDGIITISITSLFMSFGYNTLEFADIPA